MKLGPTDSPFVVVLTGAGVSAESGLPTFRGSGGVWERYRVEEVASPEAFERDPQTVLRFYNERRRQLLSAEVRPNAAHYALARLEEEMRGRFLLVTQNIDHLHEQAGSRDLVHMHGELLKQRCTFCQQVTLVKEDIETSAVCPSCGKSAGMRPHVVWFGEMPLFMEQIYAALERCDLFVSVGTSGNVYPAAGFVEVVNASGGHCVEINLESTGTGSKFQEKIYGPAGEKLPEFCARLAGWGD